CVVTWVCNSEEYDLLPRWQTTSPGLSPSSAPPFLALTAAGGGGPQDTHHTTSTFHRPSLAQSRGSRTTINDREERAARCGSTPHHLT
ncbi:hypothetical protein ALC53_10098, partial [Atta colombica]